VEIAVPRLEDAAAPQSTISVLALFADDESVFVNVRWSTSKMAVMLSLPCRKIHPGFDAELSEQVRVPPIALLYM
jgi:hypothetical protein